MSAVQADWSYAIHLPLPAQRENAQASIRAAVRSLFPAVEAQIQNAQQQEEAFARRTADARRAAHEAESARRREAARRVASPATAESSDEPNKSVLMNELKRDPAAVRQAARGMLGPRTHPWTQSIATARQQQADPLDAQAAMSRAVSPARSTATRSCRRTICRRGPVMPRRCPSLLLTRQAVAGLPVRTARASALRRPTPPRGRISLSPG
jgi:hypothetical protein